MLALSAALTTMAAPAAMPAGELIKKDPVSCLRVSVMSTISLADIAADSPVGRGPRSWYRWRTIVDGIEYAEIYSLYYGVSINIVGLAFASSILSGSLL
jgi:hypothetical protein